jgi:glycosyltransferase involved in cell wall biosynthesis
MPGRHDVAVPEPLRVAYTLEQCWHGVPGGSAAATIEVGRRLASRPDLALIGVAGRHRRQPHPAFAPPIAVRHLPIARPWLYETWNRFAWPRVERATGPVDVCHSTIAIPAATRAPHVVTIHDVAFMHTPERFTRHGVRVMRDGLERCRAADLILCPSQATAADLVALDFDASRVRVVPWGVEADPVTPADVARVRDHYSLHTPFVLFVGTVEPRKNLTRLADAVAALDTPIELVVAGASGWGDAEPVAGRARFLGFVPRADLAGLYTAAELFAYPSLQEGFGMPIAEAMAYGTPVVTSRGSATEETAGGAAVLVDATDVASIAAGLASAREQRASLVEAGLARSAQLSWEAAADATEAAYRAVSA